MLSGCRVLIVEDEFFQADDLKRCLVSHGANVIGPVSTLESGFETIAASDRIDFAVLDLNLGGHLSFEVAAQLRARDIPFVFATGYGSTQIPPGYRDVTRVEKPYAPEDLLPIIAESVSGPGRD